MHKLTNILLVLSLAIGQMVVAQRDIPEKPSGADNQKPVFDYCLLYTSPSPRDS